VHDRGAPPLRDEPIFTGAECRDIPMPRSICPWHRPAPDATRLSDLYRLIAREYERAMYRRRNEVERLFGRHEGFRRIVSRFEKLDLMFPAFSQFAPLGEGLR